MPQGDADFSTRWSLITSRFLPPDPVHHPPATWLPILPIWFAGLQELIHLSEKSEKIEDIEDAWDNFQRRRSA
ncbi:MAG: hypothetical protein WBM35_04270 [Candidatus Electrothrix sp.]